MNKKEANKPVITDMFDADGYDKFGYDADGYDRDGSNPENIITISDEDKKE